MINRALLVAKRVSVSLMRISVALPKRLRVSLRACSIFPLLFIVASAAETELHVRAGLPHLAALTAESTGELRVAYLGGSITAAPNGWRTLTTEHLRALYPKLDVIEIDAGLPGTGSNLGACRIERDVLRHQPDLLFVEFAVNDAGVPPDRIERTVEGIVRQAVRARPNIDLCFVYTVSTPALADLEQGRTQPSARAMETIAEHYGIPSIQLGIEIVRRMAAGELDFKNPSASDAARTFSLDGVHPTSAGHRIYAEVIARDLESIRSETRERFVRDNHETLTRFATRRNPSIPPLHTDNWENATLALLDSANRHGDWTLVPLDDPNLRGSTKSLLPPIWRAATPGAVVEFSFTGCRFGLLGIAAPDNGEFRVTIDDLPPITGTFFDGYVSPTFCRQREWFFPSELAAGSHHARVELLDSKIDKAGIKAAAGKPISDPASYAPRRLTLGAALVVGVNSP